jgi:hypothetical protein
MAVAEYRASESQCLFDKVVSNAASIGMKVNATKTQIMCISPDNGYKNSAYIEANGHRVESVSDMRVLGYHFDTNAGAEAHVRHIEKTAHSKLWIIRNLKKAGARKQDLIQAYTTMIRTSVEYLSVIYHPQLTLGQADRIEKVQERAVRAIVGWNKTYLQALEATGLDRLEVRRISATNKFARSIELNRRFCDKWLTINDCRTSLRKPKKYKEIICNTNRLRDSPINYYTRILNDI